MRDIDGALGRLSLGPSVRRDQCRRASQHFPATILHNTSSRTRPCLRTFEHCSFLVPQSSALHTMSFSSPIPHASASSRAAQARRASFSGQLAFLVHSQESVANHMPPDVDNKALARQKRRRTRYISPSLFRLKSPRCPHFDALERALAPLRLTPRQATPPHSSHHC